MLIILLHNVVHSHTQLKGFRSRTLLVQHDPAPYDLNHESDGWPAVAYPSVAVFIVIINVFLSSLSAKVHA